MGWIKAVGDCVRMGATVQNTLKGVGTEKRGETKIFKMGQAGSRGRRLKKGPGIPLQTMLLMHFIFCLNVLEETLFSK